LQATGYVRNGTKDAGPQWLGQTWTHPVERLRQRVRSAIDALVAGRAMAGIVAALLVGDQGLQADWLLVPHHGSATSSTQAFLDAVRQHVAIVQAGYRNRFGHPRPDVLRRYNDLGVLVVQTPRCGASIWRSEQSNLVQCERDQRQRYW
jgi:competence protein ComEC